MPAKVLPLRSFAPDLDPTTPGVLVDSNDFVPSFIGFATLPDLQALTRPLPAQYRGGAAVSFSDGTQWTVAGCYDDATGSSYLCVIPSVALDPDNPPAWSVQLMPPVVAPIQHWRFAMFNDQIIAVNGVQPPFTATNGRLQIAPELAWQFLAGGPPIASLVASTDYYLFLVGELPADIPNGSYPVHTNHWWASADETKWTLDIADLSVDGRLNTTPGPITALLALRSQMVAYKNTATHLGSLGGPAIWTFAGPSRQSGAFGQEGVISVNDVHRFIGPNDFFGFDGFSISNLPNDLRRWFARRVNRIRRAEVTSRFDENRNVIFWHYPTNDNPNPALANEWVAMHVLTGQWTTGQWTIQGVMQSTTQDVLHVKQDLASGVIGLDGILYVHRTDNQRTTYGAFLTLGDAIGDRHFMWTLQNSRPAFTTLNGTPVLTILCTQTSGTAYAPRAPVGLTADGWFHIVETARLIRPSINCNAECEIANLEVEVRQAGDA